MSLSETSILFTLQIQIANKTVKRKCVKIDSVFFYFLNFLLLNIQANSYITEILQKNIFFLFLFHYLIRQFGNDN